jgi:hypothetical protein
MKQSIAIPLNKNKLILLLSGSIIFIAMGIWFVVAPPSVSNPVLGNPVLIFCVGIVSIIFIGFGAVLFVKKLSDRSPGLIINDQGITDNSGGTSVGFIPWTEIVKIVQTTIANQKFLILFVQEPEKYIQKEKGFKKKFMQMNYNSYGSPVTISTNALGYNADELYRIIVKKFNEHKKG